MPLLVVKSLMERSAAERACLKVKKNPEVRGGKVETVEDAGADLPETFERRVQGLREFD